jgi:hypothetical protein
MTKAGRYRGFDPDGIAEREADYFGYCPVCGAYIDTRDLGQVLAHIHDAEIEISEGPAPPRAKVRCTKSARALWVPKTLSELMT